MSGAEVRARRVVRYQTAEGREPFTRWFERQREGRGKIVARIARIEETGGFGDAKSVGDGVFELRFFGQGPAYRVYYGDDKEDDQIVLLCGGTKATQDSDILRAKGYWEDYNA